MPVRVESLPGETAFVSVGRVWATGLHQVDNPVFDSEGNLYVTYSGSRGQEAPVSIFRVTTQGTREPFASGIVNATSMAIGPDASQHFQGYLNTTLTIMMMVAVIVILCNAAWRWVQVLTGRIAMTLADAS